MEIVLATYNQHKLEEARQIVGGRITLVPLGQYVRIEIKEVGTTLLENSLLKAEFAFKLTGRPVIADDSGLFVDALGGAPGVASARYADSDQARIQRVLREMGRTTKRSARFKAVYVYYPAPGSYRVFEGVCEGRIAQQPAGNSGFGYDPIFIPQGFRRTFAQLGPLAKNRISHRARALRKFIAYLRRQP